MDNLYAVWFQPQKSTFEKLKNYINQFEMLFIFILCYRNIKMICVKDRFCEYIGPCDVSFPCAWSFTPYDIICHIIEASFHVGGPFLMVMLMWSNKQVRSILNYNYPQKKKII